MLGPLSTMIAAAMGAELSELGTLGPLLSVRAVHRPAATHRARAMAAHVKVIPSGRFDTNATAAIRLARAARSPKPLAPSMLPSMALCTRGWAKARARAANNRMRNKSSKKCLSCQLLLCSCRVSRMNRNAGKSISCGCRCPNRCSMIGTVITANPAISDR